MKKNFPSFILMMLCLIVHYYFTHLGQEKNRKRFIISGIILTLLGLVYSTLQTTIIIKSVNSTKSSQ